MSSDDGTLSAMSADDECLWIGAAPATFTDDSLGSAIMITHTTPDRHRVEKAGTTANEWEER